MIALTVIAGTGGPQKAIITMDIDGQHITKKANGDGLVDATFKAIRTFVPHEAHPALYQVSAVDAQAEVSVRLEAGASPPARARIPTRSSPPHAPMSRP